MVFLTKCGAHLQLMKLSDSRNTAVREGLQEAGIIEFVHHSHAGITTGSENLKGQNCRLSDVLVVWPKAAFCHDRLLLWLLNTGARQSQTASSGFHYCFFLPAGSTCNVACFAVNMIASTIVCILVIAFLASYFRDIIRAAFLIMLEAGNHLYFKLSARQ